MPDRRRSRRQRSSAAYDFGISWFETSQQPQATPEAPGGHSVHIEATAVRGTEEISLIADVDVLPQYQGQRAVPTAAVSADVASDRVTLEIAFDAASWLKQLDFDAIAASSVRPFVIVPGTAEHNAILLSIKNLSPPEFRWVEQSTNTNGDL